MLWLLGSAPQASGTFSCGVAATINAVGTFCTPGSSTASVGPVGNTPTLNKDDDQGASPNGIP
jgi:hypothetical protein